MFELFIILSTFKIVLFLRKKCNETLFAAMSLEELKLFLLWLFQALTATGCHRRLEAEEGK